MFQFHLKSIFIHGLSHVIFQRVPSLWSSESDGVSTNFCSWSYSKSPHIRTYFFEIQAEIGSYFKDTMTNIRVYRFLFEEWLV